MREGTVFGESRLVADILQRPAAELERAAWAPTCTGRHARRNRRDEVGPAVRDRTETDAGAAGVTRRRRHGDRRLVNLRLELELRRDRRDLVRDQRHVNRVGLLRRVRRAVVRVLLGAR